MTAEPSLRLCGFALLVAAMAIGGHHRVRAERRGGPVSRRAEGPVLMIALRAAAGLWALGFVLWLVNPDLVRWAEMPLPPALRWVGAGLLALSVPFYGWVFHHLGDNVTDTVVTRRAHTLVRTGPYRWVRHPLYTGGVIFVAGWVLLTASALVAVTAVLAGALLVLRTGIEERFLLERFGDDYRAYRDTTGRFFPRWRRG